MTLHPLIGHLAAQDRVRRAMAEERLPHGILITGPAGVGKQRFGLWVAQLLLCDEQSACGQCRPCRQVLGLAHPDLHWMVPVLRPKAGELDKQVEELAETLGQVMEERRQNPLYDAPDGMAGHFVATARLLQRRAAMTPAQGRRKVFLLGFAERLVPQESSQEAANALLKLLEEPPADSYFLLTTEDANRLLATVRSRLVPLRLGRLVDAEVERFLETAAGVGGAALKDRVLRARGSIGRGLAVGEGNQKATRAAEDLLGLLGGGAGARAERALKQGPFAARGDFTAMLDALAEQLAQRARDAADRGEPLESLVAAQARVAAAREVAQRNVNPQLLLAVLTDDLAEVLA